MAVLVFGIYMFTFCLVGSVVVEVVIPKVTTKKVDPTWPGR
jgi:hypothetical protein